MALEFSYDSDLRFLENLTDEQLVPLVRILTKDKDGDPRLTEQLTLEDRYNQHQPEHSKYWDLIAAEYEDFGSHTFGGKKPYREILCNVCDKQDVNYNRNSGIELIEQNLLQKVLRDSLDRMSAEDLEELARELNIKPTVFTPDAVWLAMQVGIRSGGFAPYVFATTVLSATAKLFGLVLPFIAYTTLTRTMAIVAGPIGWVISTLWFAVSIGGPAYRVVGPATIVIACLRIIHQHEKSEEGGD